MFSDPIETVPWASSEHIFREKWRRTVIQDYLCICKWYTCYILDKLQEKILYYTFHGLNEIDRSTHVRRITQQVQYPCNC